jgi:glycosyltransferase involved in cell wall biosynthesis
MPCLNEAETLGICIQKATNFLIQNNINGEIVIGDNGSSDGSQAIAEAMGARVINVTEKGYGNALIGAIHAAEGKYILMGDSDDSYDFNNLMPFLAEIRTGKDLVMGNRFKGGIEKGAMPFLHYYLGNPVLSFIGRLFFKSKIGDFHCGIRCFTKEAFYKMDLQTTGMEFATEMIVKAELLSLKISEVPTKLYPDGRSRPPHLRTWRDGWRHLRFMLLYSPAWLFLYPGILLAFIGLSVGTLLFFKPISVQGIELDINTLFYMGVFLLTGTQSIFFYLVSRSFAIKEKLLPFNSSYEKLINSLSLEIWIIVGISLITLGLWGSFYAVNYWREYKFGTLNPQEALRITIPSIIAILLGVQVFMTGFLLGLMGLKRK